MKSDEQIEQLLRQALPPLDSGAEPARDLWPAVLRRLDAPAAVTPGSLRQNWFDWALLAGLIIFAALFPATIPVFLYYL
ncbi:MAG: hypothetical protein WBC92_20160 [Terracidiphilus sp.]